jgi:hypothetical protein
MSLPYSAAKDMSREDAFAEFDKWDTTPLMMAFGLVAAFNVPPQALRLAAYCRVHGVNVLKLLQEWREDHRGGRRT